MHRLALSIVVLIAFALTACGESSDGSNGNTNAGTSGTASGGSSSGGQAGASNGGQTSEGGNAGEGGNLGGAGQATGGSAGTTNAGGTGGTDAGTTDVDAGGTDNDAGTPAEPPWSCPAGPFPEPQVGQIDTLCADFNFTYNYLEGPTWVKSENALYFSNFDIGTGTHGDIIKYTFGGQCEVFTTEVGCNGLAVGLNGTIVGACQRSRSVESFNLATKAQTTLASMYMGHLLDTPNDLIVRSNGAIYFTNRTAELDGRPVDYGTAVFWIDPAGTLNLIEQGGDGNGIALSPDERTLYVNNKGSWALDENGVPGAKGPQIVNGDGLAVDCAGNLYMSGGQIVNAQGQNIGNFPAGTNMAFGGPDGTLLFVVSDGHNVRALHMNLPGLP